MKILIVSDTHGRFEQMKQVIATEKPLDILVHCGDLCGDLGAVLGRKPGFQVFAVQGNCDMPGKFPAACVIELGDHKIFLTHGHLYNVRKDNRKLVRAAKENGCDMVMFGHTHLPENVIDSNICILNPGSLSEPRTKDGRPSYAVMTIHDKTGETNVELHYIDPFLAELY